MLAADGDEAGKVTQGRRRCRTRTCSPGSRSSGTRSASEQLVESEPCTGSGRTGSSSTSRRTHRGAARVRGRARRARPARRAPGLLPPALRRPLGAQLGARSARPARRRCARGWPRASSSESVRSGDWNATRSATDLRPSGIWSPRYTSKTRRVAELGRGLAQRRDELARGDVLVDDEREVLAHGRVRDHVLVDAALGRERGELVEVELEGAQAAVEQRTGAARRASRPATAPALPGWRSSGRCVRSTCSSIRSAAKSVSTAPLARAKPPSVDPGRRAGARPAAARRSGGRRARSRRARCPRCRRRRCAAPPRRAPGRASCAAPPARRRAARGAGSRSGRGRSSTRLDVYASSKPGADERVLDRAPQPLRRRQPAREPLERRQRERDLVQVHARDLLDHVGLARHVARAPGRNGRPSSRRATSKPSRSRSSRWSSGGTSSPFSASARSGRNADDRPLGQVAVHVGRARPARAGELDEQLASRGRRPARRGAGRRPSPSGSSPRCAARAARSVRRIPTGSKFAASRSTFVVSGRTSVSSPPMIAGERDRRASPSAMTRIGRVELAQRAVERRAAPRPGRARPDDDPAAARACRSRTRAAGCRARA